MSKFACASPAELVAVADDVAEPPFAAVPVAAVRVPPLPPVATVVTLSNDDALVLLSVLLPFPVMPAVPVWTLPLSPAVAVWSNRKLPVVLPLMALVSVSLAPSPAAPVPVAAPPLPPFTVPLTLTVPLAEVPLTVPSEADPPSPASPF